MPPRKKKPEPEQETPTPQEQETPPEPEQDDSREVAVPFGDNPSDTATLLLAAAEESGVDQSVVRASSGTFYVPAGIAKKAGVEVQKDDEE